VSERIYDSRARLLRGEGGFTIVESTVALTVVFGLLGAAGVRGVVTGSQRTNAMATASKVLETAGAWATPRWATTWTPTPP
jgi:hypothetical protein